MLGVTKTRGWRTRLCGLLAACALAAALAPTAASADVTAYWNGDSGGTGLAGRHGDLTRSLLTASDVFSNSGGYEVWAGAHYSGGQTLYASWATGIQYACHQYGTANIGAMFETPYTQQTVAANAGWQGAFGSWYC